MRKDVANSQTRPNCKVDQVPAAFLQGPHDWFVLDRAELLPKMSFFKWQLETSWTRDALKHTRDTWMTVLQIHEYGITLHKYGWFLYTCKLISRMCCIYYRDRRTRRQLVWRQVNILNLLLSQTTEVLSEHLRWMAFILHLLTRH